MNLQQLENLIEDIDEIDMTDRDYGIIITADGKLKMLVIPDEVESQDEVPDVVAEILSLFSEDSIAQQHRVIH